MGLHINNALRYVMWTNCTRVLDESLCAALPGFHAFSGSDYTASFNRKDKIWHLKNFFCFERTIT